MFNILLFLIAPLTVVSCWQTEPEWWVKRNYDTISKIYNLTVYPQNEPIITRGISALPPGLFADNCRGRVSPVGNFTNKEDSIEYFFGLSPTPDTNPSGQGFHEATVTEFTSGCPEIASSVVYLKAIKMEKGTGKVLGGPETILKEVAFWRFDEKGQVSQYDAWIPNLSGWVFAAQNGLNYSSPQIQKLAVSMALCPQIEQRCTGVNQQFANTSECDSVLGQKPFGNFDEVWGDNIVCRIIHVLLTKVRPQAHCPHVGPKGGNGPDNWKCVNVDYRNEYFNDAEIFQGRQFMCPQVKSLLGW